MGFKLPPVFCGCKTMIWRRLNNFGADGGAFEVLDQRAHKCCKTAYLGPVYSNLPSYGSDTPCNSCIVCKTNDQGECYTESTEAPHGREARKYTRQCSKLLILQDAVTNSTITATKKTLLLSRAIESLPYLWNPQDNLVNNQVYVQPIQCPPTNRLFECCQITRTSSGGNTSTWTERVMGPFENCEIDCVSSRPPNGQAGNVCEDNKAQIYGFPITPCFVEPGLYRDDGTYYIEPSFPMVMSGYASDSLNWWFLSDSSYESMLSDAAAIDPYANTGIKHSVVFHFTLVTRTIYCCAWNCSCGGGTPSRSSNWRTAKCGDSSTKVLGGANKAEREQNVEIYAFVGFTEEFCGYTPERACQVLYEETE